ncbi:hypothetical protein B0T26DRAFT_678955 [Lasiosphaeria miniovina]|uniref:Uncharacterized protein n=1 Tax=Lasiosphaeria miniovina TaxID=1954250 RepID=A0AA40A580_9PEZI|nr:uncharacterized protein B0T26DRAFT_678955 [Lasiosphaeria miniovina]KAK0709556.1 hypothetical protein B0T26DRAFT_678955 [Lasiosphaeria miniovina]
MGVFATSDTKAVTRRFIVEREREKSTSKRLSRQKFRTSPKEGIRLPKTSAAIGHLKFRDPTPRVSRHEKERRRKNVPKEGPLTICTIWASQVLRNREREAGLN